MLGRLEMQPGTRGLQVAAAFPVTRASLLLAPLDRRGVVFSPPFVGLALMVMPVLHLMKFLPLTWALACHLRSFSPA